MWEAIKEIELANIIHATEIQLASDPDLEQLWQTIKISPQKWQCSPWGDMGGGFWVVAIASQMCIYYNDIEDGFNISRYKYWGEITDYWCNQDKLIHCLRQFQTSTVIH